MWNKILALAFVFCLFAPFAQAQTVRGDRITLNTGPCTERSGAGTPEGVQSGNPCDSWRDTTTGLVYEKVTGTATTTGWKRLVGATGATCTTFAGCVAATIELDTLAFTQQLRTDHSFKLQQSVTEDGARLEAFNGGGWMPLRLSGGPVRVEGGGLHVGSAVVADAGLGNVDIDGFVGVPGYTSQTTGWRITSAGASDFRYLYTDELHAKAFIADLEQALAGGQIISKSVAKIGTTFTVPSAGSISTLTVQDLPSADGMAVFESGDSVRLRTFSRAAGSLTIADAWGTVTGYADAADGLQTWTFQRAVTNGGSISAGTEIAIDSIVLDYGVSGNGFYEVNAIDGVYGVNSPYAQIVTWSGNTPIAANQTVRTRFGNLLGITGTAEYGLLAGTYAATNGRYFIGSDQHFELHGIDLSLWSGATRVLYAEHTTPYWSMGNPAPTSFSSGTGCWQGMDAGVFKWRCGDISGGTQYIAWNGTQLTVSGSIVVVGTAIDASSVNGVAGATIVSGAARGLLGIDANGNPLLPATATPSGSGLFLGSDFMGYYTAGAWKTYMDNAGGFYLGGASGALQWNGTALTVTATLAGNGSAVTSITGTNITTGSITAGQIAADTITAANIAAGAITASELSADSVTSAAILAGTIVASDIASGTITATQVSAGTFVSTGGAGADVNGGATTINGGMITTNSITSSQIAAGTIVASDIAAGTITGSLISAATIAGTNIAGTTITASNLAAGAVTATKIDVDGSIAISSGGNIRQGQTAYNVGAGFWLGDDSGTAKFSIGNPAGNHLTWDGSTLTYTGVGSGLTALDGGNLQSGTVTNGSIAAGTITAAKLNVTDLSAITANLGTITAGSVTLGSAGYVRQGQTAYNTGTGFWLGDVSGTAKFSIGSSTNSLTWDGSKLTVNGTYVPESASYATLGNGGNTATTYTPSLFLTNSSASNYDRICVDGNSGSGGCNDAAEYATGTQITVIVSGTGTVTVRHLQMIGGSTGNGFVCPGAVDFTRATTESFNASYDGTHWVVTSKS